MKQVILCVDDEKIIIMSLVEQLWDHFGDKYSYEMAMSGDEALEIVDELVLDDNAVILIISDWLMSGMRGDELVIKVHERYPQVITIMLSGQADPAAVNNAREKGVLNAYISKPWDKDILMKTIEDLIEESKR